MLTNNKVLRGRYRIIQPLGQEAASSVYEAYDSERETNVALKEILIDLEKVANISQREKIKHDFANQAKILAKVKHESLPQVRGYFAEVDRHYLIMELVDGAVVDKMSSENDDSTSISEVANWADQLLDALDYLHTFSPAIVHHDINPANVKITSRGKIKLLGFSLINRSDAETSMTVRSHSSVTVVNYLPLEQIIRVADQSSKKRLTDSNGDLLKKILKQPTNARSDIYALGATIYYLLTKQIPANALERTLEIWAAKPDPLPTAHQANAKVPAEISDVLAKAMAIECENRFDSAAQMRQELQTAFKKAQERTVEEEKKQEVAAAREAFLAEEKRLEKERQVVEKERQRIEAERKQQAELIERQLKEAEAQRIEAEKRAVEAEKRLSENQKSSAANAKSADALKGENAHSKSGSKSPVFESPKSLFTEAPTEKKSSLMMPAIIFAFLVIGGITAGILLMRSSNAAASNQPSAATAPAVMAEKTVPESTVSTPPATIEKISETVEVPKVPSSVVTTVSQNSPKPKVAQPTPAPKAVKPAAAPPTKVATNQKKAVTVDDIIGN